MSISPKPEREGVWKMVHNMLLVVREEHGTGSYGIRAPGWRVGVLQRLLSGLFPHPRAMGGTASVL